MDADYCRNFSEDGKHFHEFVNSLFVLATVQSVQVNPNTDQVCYYHLT